MIIESPAMLFALFGLIPVILVFLYEYRHTMAALRQLGRTLTDESVRRLIFGKWLIGLVCFCGFYLSCILAMAGWEWGEEASQRDRSGLDLVVVVDSSRSMLVRDLSPDRIGKGLAIVGELVESLPDARVALVSFAGSASKLIPMTEDRLALRNALRSLEGLGDGPLGSDGSPAGAGASNIAQGLDLALACFPEATQRNQVVVMVSDGEFAGASFSQALNQVRKRGIPIGVIAAGTPDGGRIPQGKSGWLRDQSDREVVSRLQSGPLHDLASATRGWYFNAADDAVAGQLAASLRQFVERSAREGFILVPVSRDNVFVIMALVFLTAYLAVRAIRWRSVW